MSKLILIFVFSLFATVASAVSEVETTRGLLDKGDVAGLEAAFFRLHQSALEANDFTEIRGVVFNSMATTHEVRIETINAWNTAYPQSPYAKVAAAQMHKHIAFLYRGTQSSMRTPYQAHEKFRDEINMTISMAEDAFSIAPDYLPASDLVMTSSMAGKTDLVVQDLVAHAFNITPNRRTLKNALYALQPAWGGSTLEMYELCAEFADRIQGYDADLCIVETILENNLHMDARKIALEVAQVRLEELSEKAQLVALLDAEFPIADGMAERAVELHEKSLGSFNSLYGYRLQSGPLQRKYNWPGYKKQAYDFFMDHVERKLENDPFNGLLLSPIIHNVSSINSLAAQRGMESTAEITELKWQIWEKMHRYGQYRPSTWKTGAQIAVSGVKNGQKAFVAYPYYNNAISMSPLPHDYLGSLLHLLYNDYNSAKRNIATANGVLNPDLPPPEAVLEFTTCELVRASRLFLAICSNTSNQEDACLYTGADKYAERALALDNLDRLCPKVIGASIYDLMYTAIPLDEFGEWDLENAPGN